LAIFEKNKNMKRIIFLSFLIFISSVGKSQVIQFGNLVEKNVKKEKFLKQNELIFIQPQIKEYPKVNISSFYIKGINDDKIVFAFYINGNKIDDEHKNILKNNIKSGSKIIFYNAKGNPIDGSTLLLNSIEYIIK
jgi:hypothetical protein